MPSVCGKLNLASPVLQDHDHELLLLALLFRDTTHDQLQTSGVRNMPAVIIEL